MITAYTLGLSAAWCDGELHKDEKQEIKEFINGLSKSVLPENIKKEINNLYMKFENIVNDNPHQLLNIAIEQIKKYSSEHTLSKEQLGDFNDIVINIINADGKIHKNEQAFFKAWDTKRAQLKSTLQLI